MIRLLPDDINRQSASLSSQICCFSLTFIRFLSPPQYRIPPSHLWTSVFSAVASSPASESESISPFLCLSSHFLHHFTFCIFYIFGPRSPSLGFCYGGHCSICCECVCVCVRERDMCGPSHHPPTSVHPGSCREKRCITQTYAGASYIWRPSPLMRSPQSTVGDMQMSRCPPLLPPPTSALVAFFPSLSPTHQG